MINLWLLPVAFVLSLLVMHTAVPMPGGDRGMSYALTLVFLCGAFVVTTALLAGVLAGTGRVGWLSPIAARQYGLLFLSWLAFVVATISGMFFLIEWHTGSFWLPLRWLALSRVMIWLPLVFLPPVLWMFNAYRPGSAPPMWIRSLTVAGLAVSFFMTAGVLVGAVTAAQRRAAAQVAYYEERDQQLNREHLQSIASQTATDPILNILALSGRFHDAEVRNAAIAKIKSHPDWEDQLIKLLNQGSLQMEAYQFLDGNAVDHPERFIEPLKESMRRTAVEIRQRIASADDLQVWHMDHFSLERCLRAIDEQFAQLPGADFRPEVRQLQAALETPRPPQFAHIHFSPSAVVNEWLRKHP